MNHGDRITRRQLLAGTASGLVLMTTGCSSAPNPPTPVVTIRSGKVQGEIVDGIHRFLGIPYAAPPFGRQRFRSPVEPASWDGVRPTTAYGAICPQTGGGGLGAVPDEGEDCLNLNIWTPGPDAGGLPVMVWAHGGGQTTGTGASAIYDGTHFARDGVVLVTCNRRLGAEGYLYLEELFGDGIGPGNLGIQDLQFVLAWVQENIEAFGGNPGNVTLFGESGGGAAAQALVATPGSEGLLHRAIPQSGGHAAQRTDTATRIARRVLDELAIKPGDLDALLQVPWPDFVSCYPLLEAMEDVGQPQVYLPVLNEHMPHHPADAAHEGKGLTLDYLLGTCRDEMNLFSTFMPEMEDSIFHERAKKVIAASGSVFEDVVQSYLQSRPGLEPDDAFNAVLGDMWFRLPTLRIAEGHAANSDRSTFMYLFDWESQMIGAAHALDLVVFGNGPPVPGIGGFADYEPVANYMRKAWVEFATHGNPGWPTYQPGRITMHLNNSPAAIPSDYIDAHETFSRIVETNWQRAKL